MIEPFLQALHHIFMVLKTSQKFLHQCIISIYTSSIMLIESSVQMIIIRAGNEIIHCYKSMDMCFLNCCKLITAHTEEKA